MDGHCRGERMLFRASPMAVLHSYHTIQRCSICDRTRTGSTCKHILSGLSFVTACKLFPVSTSTLLQQCTSAVAYGSSCRSLNIEGHEFHVQENYPFSRSFTHHDGCHKGGAFTSDAAFGVQIRKHLFVNRQ